MLIGRLAVVPPRSREFRYGESGPIIDAGIRSQKGHRPLLSQTLGMMIGRVAVARPRS